MGEIITHIQQSLEMGQKDSEVDAVVQQQGKLLLGTVAARISVWDGVLPAFPSQLPAAGDNPNAEGPVMHVRDQMKLLALGLAQL